MAALLTWAALNIVGGGEAVVEQVKKAQQEVYEAVDRQITAWGIEHNEQGWRADAYLYCVEAREPQSGYMIPLAPSWVIGEKTKCIARLHRNEREKRYDIEILSGVSDEEMAAAKASGTVQDNALVNPDTGERTPIATLRGQEGLRLWENDDLVPRPGDVFQERLYCIRYVESYYLDEKGREIALQPGESPRRSSPAHAQTLRGSRRGRPGAGGKGAAVAARTLRGVAGEGVCAVQAN